MRREEPTLSLCVIKSWDQDQFSSWTASWEPMVVSVVLVPMAPMEAPLVVAVNDDVRWFHI
jgi:hypothetical protein